MTAVCVILFLGSNSGAHPMGDKRIRLSVVILLGCCYGGTLILLNIFGEFRRKQEQNRPSTVVESLDRGVKKSLEVDIPVNPERTISQGIGE